MRPAVPLPATLVPPVAAITLNPPLAPPPPLSAAPPELAASLGAAAESFVVLPQALTATALLAIRSGCAACASERRLMSHDFVRRRNFALIMDCGLDCVCLAFGGDRPIVHVHDRTRTTIVWPSGLSCANQDP